MTAGYGGLGLEGLSAGAARVVRGVIHLHSTAGCGGAAASAQPQPAVPQGFEM